MSARFYIFESNDFRHGYPLQEMTVTKYDCHFNHSILTSPGSSAGLLRWSLIFKPRSASSTLVLASRRIPAAGVPQYGQMFHGNSISRSQFSQVFLSLV